MLLNKKHISIVVALIAVLTLTACHPRVAPVSMMDKELSCSALHAEIKEVEDIKAKIEANRGFSGRNVALALFFWPGIVINEVTGSTAESEANSRLVALKNLYFENNCSAKLAEKNKSEQADKKA